jgi:hypothetical protein
MVWLGYIHNRDRRAQLHVTYLGMRSRGLSGHVSFFQPPVTNVQILPDKRKLGGIHMRKEHLNDLSRSASAWDTTNFPTGVALETLQEL